MASLWSWVGNLTAAGLAGAVSISPGHSPLQGLINCLKEILEPGPQGPEGPRSSPPPPAPSLGASQLTRAELGPGGPPWAGESLRTCLLGPRFLSLWRAPVALCRYFSVKYDVFPKDPCQLGCSSISSVTFLEPDGCVKGTAWSA